MSVEVESDYRKSSWLKSFRVLGASKYPKKIVLRPSRESGGMLPWKF